MSADVIYLYIESKDCFGGTAMDDAKREGHKECQAELDKAEWNSELEMRLQQQIIN